MALKTKKKTKKRKKSRKAAKRVTQSAEPKAEVCKLMIETTNGQREVYPFKLNERGMTTCVAVNRSPGVREVRIERE